MMSLFSSRTVFTCVWDFNGAVSMSRLIETVPLSAHNMLFFLSRGRNNVILSYLKSILVRILETITHGVLVAQGNRLCGM